MGRALVNKNKYEMGGLVKKLPKVSKGTSSPSVQEARALVNKVKKN
jgi:hypothetical protein